MKGKGSKFCTDCHEELPPPDVAKAGHPAYRARRRCLDRKACQERWFKKTAASLRARLVGKSGRAAGGL